MVDHVSFGTGLRSQSPDNSSNDAVCGTVVGDHQGSLLGSIPMTVMTDPNLTPDGLPAAGSLTKPEELIVYEAILNSV